MKLYVGNLSFSTTEEEITELFSQVGTVQSTRLMTDRDTGQSRGFAFVELSNRSEGEAAIQKFNGFEFNGRTLKTNEAKPQENRGGGGGGGFRRDNNRGGGGRGGGRGGYNRY